MFWIYFIFSIVIVLLLLYNKSRKNDPAHNCKVYLSKGCCYVDGYMCNMEQCIILEKYLIEEKSSL